MMAVHDDRKLLVSFKSAKPKTGIDPELLGDDGMPLLGAAVARLRIHDRMRALCIEPGSAAHAAVQRHMRHLVRLEARTLYAGTDLVRELKDNPKLLDRNHLRAV